MESDQPRITAGQRARHLAWLKDVTQIPTASGRERRAIRWVERWAAERDRIELTRDPAGNLHLARRDTPAKDSAPIYFTAHLDHPAFVVERIVAPTVAQVSFRGGVMDEYFKDARIVIWTDDDQPVRANLTGEAPGDGPFKHYLAELRSRADFRVGDVAVWDVGDAEVIDGTIHTLACDDLAALAAAIAAMDVLLGEAATQDVRLLFTRAEEIGFVGAIAATRHSTMPKGSRVIALENSRSFDDSPIGGGPIVRVGDRISIFSPTLTDAIAKRAEDVAGGPASATASQKLTELPRWKWQRKLMAGGACEASVFCHAGYEATCVCLPLGNYHNMGDLANVQAGKNLSPPTVAREFISVADFEGLVDLLVACGRRLPPKSALGERFEKLWAERAFVLGEAAGRAAD